MESVLFVEGAISEMLERHSKDKYKTELIIISEIVS